MKKIHVNFEKWYLGYVIILVFVLMVVGYTNTWFYKNYKAQTENINEYVKDGVVQNLNDFFRTIDSVALNICTDEGIDLLNGASNLNDLYRNTTALKLVENMYKFGKISDDIGEIYIYNKNNDVVVSSKGIYGSKHFYDMSIAPCGEDYKQWKHRIDDIGTGHRFERYNNKIEYNIKLDSGNINKSKNGNIVFGIIFDKKSFINDIPYVEWIKRCNIYIYMIQMVVYAFMRKRRLLTAFQNFLN